MPVAPAIQSERRRIVDPRIARPDPTGRWRRLGAETGRTDRNRSGGRSGPPVAATERRRTGQRRTVVVARTPSNRPTPRAGTLRAETRLPGVGSPRAPAGRVDGLGRPLPQTAGNLLVGAIGRQPVSRGWVALHRRVVAAGIAPARTGRRQVGHLGVPEVHERIDEPMTGRSTIDRGPIGDPRPQPATPAQHSTPSKDAPRAGPHYPIGERPRERPDAGRGRRQPQ